MDELGADEIIYLDRGVLIESARHVAAGTVLQERMDRLRSVFETAADYMKSGGWVMACPLVPHMAAGLPVGGVVHELDPMYATLNTTGGWP